MREWIRSGLPEDAASLRRFGLSQRARPLFGSWSAAVEASGAARPETAPVRTIPRDRAEAIDALAGVVSDALISRVLGCSIFDATARRRWLGIPARLSNVEARIAACPELGILPDAVVARRVGTLRRRVAAVREALGLPSAPGQPRGRIGTRTWPLSEQERERIRCGLGELSERSAHVLRERFVREPPRARADLARELGVSAVRAKEIEDVALARLGIVTRSAPPPTRVTLELPRDRARLERAVDALGNARWKWVLTERFLSEPQRTHEAVAQDLGLSPGRVWRIEQNALERLGFRITASGVSWQTTLSDEERGQLRESLHRLGDERAELILRERLLREPPRSRRDLARELGVSVERVTRIQRAALDRLGLAGAPDPARAPRARLSKEDRARLRAALPTLGDAHAEFVLRERFLREPPRTQADVARMLGLSGATVTQIGAGALRRLGITPEYLRLPRAAERAPKKPLPRSVRLGGGRPPTSPRPIRATAAPRDPDTAAPRDPDTAARQLAQRADAVRRRLTRSAELARRVEERRDQQEGERAREREVVGGYVRAWIEAGLPTDTASRRRHGLDALARRWFDSWRGALEAVDAQAPRIRRGLPDDPKAARDVMLWLLSSAAVACITGAPIGELRKRRRSLPEVRRAERERMEASIRECGLLEERSAAYIAAQLGVTESMVIRIRRELGMSTGRSPARAQQARAEHGEEWLRSAIGGLDARTQLILTERCLRQPPRPLAEIGAMLGVTRERVRQIEKHALDKLGLKLQ